MVWIIILVLLAINILVNIYLAKASFGSLKSLLIEFGFLSSLRWILTALPMIIWDAILVVHFVYGEHPNTSHNRKIFGKPLKGRENEIKKIYKRDYKLSGNDCIGII